MVIAPLIGPALAASVGTITDDDELFWKGIKYQALGLGLSIAGAAVFAWILKEVGVVPPGVDLAAIDEIAERFTPDLLLLAVALGAGVAGVLALSTGISVAIVGVMIAAALIPPAAAAGIAIAWGLALPAIGATVLVLVNTVSVNLAGLLTLWYTGYRPQNWFDIGDVNRKIVRNVVVFSAIVVLLSAFLVGVTFSSYQAATIEAEIESEIEETLAQEEYEQLTLIEVETRLEGDIGYERADRIDATQRIDRVVVTVGLGPEGETPGLADELHDRVNQHTEEEVSIQVRYVYIEER
jgi:uncharacterized hydrophobic protein (TIGR00271 family)